MKKNILLISRPGICPQLVIQYPWERYKQVAWIKTDNIGWYLFARHKENKSRCSGSKYSLPCKPAKMTCAQTVKRLPKYSKRSVTFQFASSIVKSNSVYLNDSSAVGEIVVRYFYCAIFYWTEKGISFTIAHWLTCLEMCECKLWMVMREWYVLWKTCVKNIQNEWSLKFGEKLGTSALVTTH